MTHLCFHSCNNKQELSLSNHLNVRSWQTSTADWGNYVITLWDWHLSKFTKGKKSIFCNPHRLTTSVNRGIVVARVMTSWSYVQELSAQKANSVSVKQWAQIWLETRTKLHIHAIAACNEDRTCVLFAVLWIFFTIAVILFSSHWGK